MTERMVRAFILNFSNRMIDKGRDFEATDPTASRICRAFGIELKDILRQTEDDFLDRCPEAKDDDR